MTKIAIIGNAGGGKSTISRRLRDMLKLPLFPIDLIQWLPGWKVVSKERFAEEHARLLTEPCWIIDGWGDFQFIEERFREADTIILVDYPLWRHYWWALKRQFMCLFRPRSDGPPGCPMLRMTWRLLKMIWAIDKRAMPKLRETVSKHRGHAKVFHLRTLRDLREFYIEAQRHTA